MTWAKRALSEHLVDPPLHRYLAAGLAMEGRPDKARRVMVEHVRLAPQARLSNAGDWMPPYRRPEYTERFLEALRIAGMPE